jgi:hypothetical protein
VKIFKRGRARAIEVRSVAFFVGRRRGRFVLHFAISRCQPSPSLFRMIIKGAHASAICDPSLFNNVNALWPRRICIICGITHIVDSKLCWIVEALNKIIGNRYALFQRLRLRVTNIFFHVRLHLPFVRGMRFAHIHGQKVRMIFVVFVNLHDVANLAPERRSGVAAEDNHQRPSTGALSNMKAAAAVQ